MRYDADYGAASEEANPTSFDRFVPGFSRGPIDLMYGVRRGPPLPRRAGSASSSVASTSSTRSAGGRSTAARCASRRRASSRVEVYGGLERRGGCRSRVAGRCERDGVWRGDRTGYRPHALSVVPAERRRARVSAPRSSPPASRGCTGGSRTGACTTPATSNVIAVRERRSAARSSTTGTRVSQERIGYGFDGTLPDIGGVKGGLVYDLYANAIANLFASVDALPRHERSR